MMLLHFLQRILKTLPRTFSSAMDYLAEPVLSTDRDRPDGSLQVVGVERDIRILEKDPKSLLPRQGVVGRFGEEVGTYS